MSASCPDDKPIINRSLCSSIGLHRISLVRASGESFRRRVFDALEGTRGAYLLGELFCRRPVLPSPAPPPRRAPRPDPPVVCPGFGLDKSVYIRFTLLVLPRGRSGQLSSMPWGARGSVVSWANRPFGVRSCPVRPRPAAPLRAAPNRSTRGMSRFWVRQVYM